MVRSSVRARPGHAFSASLPPHVPSLASVVPLAAFAFPAILLPLSQVLPLSSPENHAPAVLRNDEIAASRPVLRHAQSQAAGRFAKCERKAGRNAALRGRANTTGPVTAPLPGHESGPSRGFAISLPCRVPDRLRLITLHAHTIAETIPVDPARSVVSLTSRPARAGNVCRYAHIPPSSRKAGVIPSSPSASLWSAQSQNTSRPALRS